MRRIVTGIFLVAMLGMSAADIFRHRDRYRREREDGLPTTLRELGWRRWLAREFDLLPWRARLSIFLVGFVAALAVVVQIGKLFS